MRVIMLGGPRDGQSYNVSDGMHNIVIPLERVTTLAPTLDPTATICTATVPIRRSIMGMVADWYNRTEQD